MSALPTHIEDWADVIIGQWNDTEGSGGGWLFDPAGHMCAWNATDDATQAALSPASSNVYVRRRVVINVYVVVGLCAFGFVGNALTVAVLRHDKVGERRRFLLLRLASLFLSSTYCDVVHEKAYIQQKHTRKFYLKSTKSSINRL